MKLKEILLVTATIAVISISLGSCGGSNENEDDSNATEVKDTAATVEEDGTVKLEAGMSQFDFPKTSLTGEVGSYVLTPGYKMWQNSLAAENPQDETFIYYTANLSAVGDVESDIEFTFDGIQKMPNSLVIVIPKGQEAKKGDIVLTWWQTGSGMQRAIVTDDSNPKEPKVVYLDIDFDNPATDSESGVSIGQTEYQLKADSFVKITDEWQEGNMIAANDNGKWNSVQIVKLAGDKVLTLGFAGKMKVYNKSDCKTIPIIPSVAAGDKVQAVFVGSFGEYEVKKIDKKTGRVFVEQYGSLKAVPYGQVVSSL